MTRRDQLLVLDELAGRFADFLARESVSIHDDASRIRWAFDRMERVDWDLYVALCLLRRQAPQDFLYVVRSVRMGGIIAAVDGVEDCAGESRWESANK